MMKQLAKKLLHLAATPLRWAFQHSGMVGGTAIDPEEIEEDLRDHFLKNTPAKDLLLAMLQGSNCHVVEETLNYNDGRGPFGTVVKIFNGADDDSYDCIQIRFDLDGSLEAFPVVVPTDDELLIWLLSNAGIAHRITEHSHGYGGTGYISFKTEESYEITAAFQEGAGLDEFFVDTRRQADEDS